MDGLNEIMLRGGSLGDVALELGVLAAFGVVLLVLAAGTIRRG